MSSINSTAGNMATYAKKIAQGRPDMEITIDEHTEGKIYTTFDAISGRVEITAPNNAQFDEIQISLEGTVKTFVDTLSPASPNAKSNAVHRFLKLEMPISESNYPQPRVAEAGRTYTFPFNFVVPDRLLPKACTHDCTAEHVTEAHLQLPPSMGDREVSIQPDLTPEMTKIQYMIRVLVIKTRGVDGKDLVLIGGKKKLYVVPAAAEAAPLSVGTGDDQYILSKTKGLKKGVFSGKLGKITVTAAQPSAIMLPSPSSTESRSTTMATIQLRFDPHDSASQPPRLGGLNTKIKSSTFFAVRPTQELPTHSHAVSHFEVHRGVYVNTIALSSRCVESVSWTKHKPAPAYVRRNSASSSSSSDYSDNIHTHDPKDGATYFSATILVPITLPSTKTWIPTFHNCIASRIYILDLSLSIHTPGAGIPASTVVLRLPVQIAAEGNLKTRPALTAAEAAAELADADEFLRPRILEVPSSSHIGNSILQPRIFDLPPSYEDFAQPLQVAGAC